MNLGLAPLVSILRAKTWFIERRVSRDAGRGRGSLTQRQIGTLQRCRASTSPAPRALTPGCGRVIHLNHTGASLLPQPVLDAMVDHLQREAVMGGYEAADAAGPQIEHTHQALATLIGAERDEIALTDTSTTGWAAALHAFGLGAGDRVLLTRAEYASNTMTLLQLARTTGCELVLIGDDATGQVDLEELGARWPPARPRSSPSCTSPPATVS